ncbi:diaminopimelate decarboxylase [Pseudovibrio sp. Tun.PSC04-5.I4]|uniref:diaminopimelate decarboxylase n=1 Tax=Pseudovibrio sp. Tun.PSC04-5.I4 TaxID=1798213 RepID=UPI00087ED5A9|nr:diaminopimelate decarboxylase [Pseudovibrio sp. Tun.PSC04-5.I4]SDR47001.1 diaminopimelate decarboxylase [Pseudovibrio sp. Tun.PSC04-5.I4]
MPMLQSFNQRLIPILKDIAKEFGTPFHIYDEVGIRETCKLFSSLSNVMPFRQYYAVKALPNPHILSILYDERMGFDCASIPEIELALLSGAYGRDILFTSNNTQSHEFEAAMDVEAIINLDDECLLNKVSPFPDLACFRMSSGSVSQECEYIGSSEKSKFGIPYERIANAYHAAKTLGASRFGFHAMLCSNQTSATNVLSLAEIVFDHAAKLAQEVGLEFEFVNIGGGIGIPYRPEEESFNFELFAKNLPVTFSKYFKEDTSLFTECGRFVTGPHGVLVTSVTNVMEKYQTMVGVDAGMSSLMRPAMYPNAYHHITLPFTHQKVATFDVVGSLCENNDKLARQRRLPLPRQGDLMIVHDTGAHGSAMGFNYNGRLRPKELLLQRDGSVRLIRSAETTSNYFSTIAMIEELEKNVRNKKTPMVG